MIIRPHLTVPPQIAGRLVTGELVRVGGVVRWAPETPRAGQVVAWLRETSLAPSAPTGLGGMLGRMASVLRFVGGVASVVNLGATIGFGFANFRRLRRIEASQERLQGTVETGFARMDEGFATLLEGQARLQDTVEVGFATLVAGFDALLEGQEQLGEKIDQRFHEQVLAALRSAAKDAELATALPAGDPRREYRLDAILPRVSQGYEAVAIDAETRTAELVSRLTAVGGRERLNRSTADLVALYRLRMSCSAAAQRARLVAEAGQPDHAARQLSIETARLRGLTQRVGESFFGSPPSYVYDDLLHATWLEHGVTPERIGRWAAAFDPRAGSLDGAIRLIQVDALKARPIDQEVAKGTSLAALVELYLTLSSQNSNFTISEGTVNDVGELIRRSSAPRITAYDAVIRWPEETLRNLPKFCDLLDGALEDLDRLDGHAAEYAEMAARRLRVADYAERFRIGDDVPHDAPVVVFVDEEGDLCDDAGPIAKAKARSPAKRRSRSG